MTGMKEWPRPDPEKVTKLEGAERCLKTAIILFFHDEDMLAIHALVAGAHEVLRTLLLKRSERGSSIKDSVMIKPECAKEFTDLMNSTQNFLKHADRDPDAVHDFYPNATVFWMFDCMDMHQRLTGTRKYKVFHIFIMWFVLEHPQYLNMGALRDDAQAFRDGHGVSKSHFYELVKNPALLPIKDLL
jgi:hypothetical protein